MVLKLTFPTQKQIKNQSTNESPFSLYLDYLQLPICRGPIFANTLIEHTDWRGESKSVFFFHLLQLPLAADPELLKFRVFMEIIELVKGCLRKKVINFTRLMNHRQNLFRVETSMISRHHINSASFAQPF